jgi:hypothetical protein
MRRKTANLLTVVLLLTALNTLLQLVAIAQRHRAIELAKLQRKEID